MTIGNDQIVIVNTRRKLAEVKQRIGAKHG